MKFRLIVDPAKEEEVVATVHQPSDLTDRIAELIREQGDGDGLLAYGEDELTVLHFSNIECVTVLDGKTFAIDRQGKSYRLRQRLYEVESLLPTSFIRINKSTLANKHRLSHFVTSFNGSVDAVFKCGHRDYVSRRCFAEIKRRFTKK